MRRFELATFIRAIAALSISEIFVPPPAVIGIPQSALCSREALSSLRQIWMGGAALKFENQKPLYEYLNTASGAQINQVWGMTEAGWITATPWGEVVPDDSVGRALDGFELL